MRTILIDDETYAIKSLKAILNLFDNQVDVIETAFSVEDAINKIDRLKPELIFLDIEMSDGNGFDVLENTNYKGYQVVFITAYSQYAVKAFRMNALDYLTKPVDPEDLISAVKKARWNHQKKLTYDYQYFIDTAKTGVFDKLGIPTSDGTRYVPLKDIIRLQASSNYTTIHIQNEKEILVSRTLKTFDKTLDGQGFLRVHQSHLVNKDYITEYHRGDGSYLVLSNKEKISVSKSRRAYLNNAFR